MFRSAATNGLLLPRLRSSMMAGLNSSTGIESFAPTLHQSKKTSTSLPANQPDEEHLLIRPIDMQRQTSY
jgi:hypothetical protein